MSKILAIVVLIALIAAVIGLLALPFKATRGWSKRLAGWSTLATVVFFVAFGLTTEREQKRAATAETDETKATQTAVSSAVPASESQPAPSAITKIEHKEPKLPADEASFIKAVTDARAKYQAGTTDLAKGAARPWRAKAICGAVRQTAVSGWAGKISSLSTNSDGKGILSVEISKDVTIGTWNNELSDVADRTLIDPESTVYASLLKFKKGDTVRFSGEFIPSATDCFRENSLTLSGSLEEPSFLLRFSRIVSADMVDAASEQAANVAPKKETTAQARQETPTHTKGHNRRH